ncbi:CUB and zona pellucida-like domain-containing protein 1 [Pempheris klunzingeri]|uniref:CUB and zona pellucida-like domain-containing protein 1 n=1 Tax=Pempheris klunzingeri TaxID=3127111 RepID=UPI00397F97F7
MASLTPRLLHLLLLVSAASAWSRDFYYRYKGGSVTFTPKGRNSDGSYQVELRSKQANHYCDVNSYGCSSGQCGTKTQSSSTIVSRNSYGLNWCQYEVVASRKLSGNLPFSIRYPSRITSSYGRGFWVSNFRSSRSYWRMRAYMDMGTRSDTGEANRPPITGTLPILRVPRNCPRTFNMTAFDADGDRVRCRVATSSSSYECGLCGLIGGFSLDSNSCSLTYTYSGQTGYHPFELLVEDFPNERITLSYSDRSYTFKSPLSAARHTTVTCNETTITVEVEKSYLIRRNEHSLHLNNFQDPSCNLSTRSNTTHLVAVMSLNMCGTLIEEDDNNIIFKNEITSADPSEIISRQHDVEIAFSCVYPKLTNLTLGFKHKNPYAFSEKGFGSFTFKFEFFESQLFRQQVDASTYPVEVYLKQMMFMQIEATSSIPNTVLFVESCRATPYDNPNSRISYTIIEHGCAKDKTVQIYPSSRAQFRFGMEAFEFIGAHEEVYITCSVMLCETNVPGTRCSQGCITSGNHRSKREVAGQSSSHAISQGPLHLVKTSDSQVSGPSLNLGMNFIFIVGCLVVCVVVIYRTRRSRAKYQPLPTSETD